MDGERCRWMWSIEPGWRIVVRTLRQFTVRVLFAAPASALVTAAIDWWRTRR